MFEGKGRVARLACLVATFLLAVFFACWPHRAFAQVPPQEAKINEVYPNPLSDSSDFEWVEIVFPQDQPAYNILDYQLSKITSSGTEYTKPLTSDICGGDAHYLVCNLGSNWLANSGTTIILKHLGLEIDKVTFGSEAGHAPLPTQGQSISRVPDTADSGDDAIDFQIVPSSRGAHNLDTIKPVSYSDQIKVNEIMPEPSSSVGDEFVELVNESSEAVDLRGWSLDDATSGSQFTIPNSLIIEAGQLLLFCKNSSNPLCINYGVISLNDNGDAVVLRDPLGSEKDRISYTSAQRGQSYSRQSGSWSWTIRPTPGLKNVIELESLVDEESDLFREMDVKSAKTLNDGETIQLSGVVSVLPGVLSSQYFYLQDETSGIQIYSYHGDFLPLEVGMLLKVRGELASYYGERRLKISSADDITIVERLQKLVPEEKALTDIVDDDVGIWISTKGCVSDTSGDTFIIIDDAEIKVIIRDTAGIAKPRMRRGDNVAVSGILSIYKGQYRILPITKDGVTILTSGKLPQTGSDLERITLWNLSAKVQPRRLILLLIYQLALAVEICYVFRGIWEAAKRPQPKHWQNTLGFPKKSQARPL